MIDDLYLVVLRKLAWKALLGALVALALSCLACAWRWVEMQRFVAIVSLREDAVLSKMVVWANGGLRNAE
jgi:hypothetical protein